LEKRAMVDEIGVDGSHFVYPSKIENRKCFRFFQKIKSYKVLFLEEMVIVDEIRS
jgi:hypothetical protein